MQGSCDRKGFWPRASTLLWAALLLLGTPSVQVRAQGVADASEEQKLVARDAYAQGKQQYAEQAYDAALESFLRSHAAVSSPNTRLMIARSLAAVGRRAEAHLAYQQTIDDAADSGEPRYQAAADAAHGERAALEPSLGRLRVVVGGNVEDPVTIGQRKLSVSALGEPVWVDPGSQQVLYASDGQTRSAMVEVAAGQEATLELGAVEPEVALEASLDDLGDGGGGGENPLEKRAESGFTAGAKIGGGLGAPVSEFGASYTLELELGWALPLPDPINHSLAIFASGRYTEPTTEGTQGQADPRLPGNGVSSYGLTQQELSLSFGLLYRVPIGSELLMPYGGAGLRVFMLNVKTAGDVADQAFGQNEETYTDYGLMVAGGLEVFAGPGAVLLEAQFGWASVEGYVLRDTSVGGLSLAVGYRVIL
ncbi:MAG: hypothetical protein OEZ06_11950 [Myxococcales bacterium]|nr:hypothetical protein [Myxococcales bacterium]